MGLFDFFGKGKKPEQKIQEAAEKAARREYKNPRRGLRGLLFGDPAFKRDMSTITRGMRQDVYEEYRQKQKKDAPLLERQRQLISDRLKRQVNIPGLERQVAQYKKAGHPMAKKMEERLVYAQRFHDRHMREYDLREARQKRDEKFAYKIQRETVGEQAWEQGRELKRETLKQIKAQQRRQTWEMMESNARPGSITRGRTMDRSAPDRSNDPFAAPQVRRLSRGIQPKSNNSA